MSGPLEEKPCGAAHQSAEPMRISRLAKAALPAGAIHGRPLSAGYDSAFARVGGCRKEAKYSAAGSELLVALYESPPYELTVAPMDAARLSINLTAVPVSGAIASARSRSYLGRRHSMFYTPTASDAHWCKPRSSRHLNIYFGNKLIEELADGRQALLNDSCPLFDIHVSRVSPWIDALELTLAEHGPSADDASLGLAHLILAKVACLPGRHKPSLSPAALTRVNEYVTAHLGEPMRIADLAAQTGLSVGRFAEHFRASTGTPPHQFILNRRIKMAEQLLRESSLPMAEVTVACGFSSQQHMATVMRRLLGVAPSFFRAQRCKPAAAEPG